MIHNKPSGGAKIFGREHYIVQTKNIHFCIIYMASNAKSDLKISLFSLFYRHMCN